MEHWQFLIQKQGARSWHILESPNLEIWEGEYRVLALSKLPNTEVEVRVTHSSTQEVQPTRRILKRSRRTNSEGLMAVIPFTYFQSGVWELRCFGDLMSDLLGKSWQYSVQLEVLPQEKEGEQRRLGENIESNSPDHPDTFSENLKFPAPAEAEITLDKAIAVFAELAIATDSSPVSIVVPDEKNLEFPAPADAEITLDKAIALSAEVGIATDSNPASIVVPDEENLEFPAPADAEITLDKAIALSAEVGIATDSNPASIVVPDEGNLEFTAPAEAEITLDQAIALSTELGIATDSNPASIVVPDEENLEFLAPADAEITLDKAIAPSAEVGIATDSNPTSIVVPDETEENRVIDEPVSPVWLKGETAEQILQNLIDLALPASELLPKDENVTDSPATQPSPPLLLTLGQDTYIARWGQPLTINGHIELPEKTNVDQAETLSPTSLQGLELGIELRSPNNSKILTQVRQPLPDQELPFTINTSIDIPADCESKLILADITLYGRFADVSEVIRLANQSFTITADVKELLAITAIAKPSTSLNGNGLIALSDSSATLTEPETAVRLDLKLFNLVKIPKTDQFQILNPSPNTPLPPQINLQVLRELALRTSKVKNSGTSPQLPKLPLVQTDAKTSTDVVAQPPTEEELLEKDATISTINLEQLVIRQRRMPKLNATFPYLRRLKALPGDAEEVKSNVSPDALQLSPAEDFPQLDAIAEDENTPESVVGDAQFQEEVKNNVSPEALQLSPAEDFPQLDAIAEDENTPELVVGDAQFQEESVAVEAQPNTQLITTGNLYSSPLLRKWMQSQGYSLPESINDLQLQNYDNYVSAQQTSLSLNAENANVDVNLPLNLDANTEMNLSEGCGHSELLLTKTRNKEGTEEVQGLASELGNFGEDVNTAKEADLEIGENTELEKVLEPTLSSVLTQLPPPLPPIKINIASAWLAQEIVVDDTYSELEADATRSYPFEEEEQPLLDLSPYLPIIAAATEPLPIPQLLVPEGELIAGKFIIVRVVLPEVPPQVVVKLWLEDYQTRWLLDGPHLLTNLLPNALGGLEVMTQLNIPFGCLEIRLEAIALDLTTQQESHKVTIVRTVVPPDLPSLQLDELLGM
ncbi:hypothetical protein [Nostoc sp. JL33]|uniref:hypothetical protein n=1 Tax=Nostoc sp. JL33 TaxID=2815396 RepID=UPI0025F881FD|nr:hypothetical protein [Nostoc sp. JL33]